MPPEYSDYRTLTLSRDEDGILLVQLHNEGGGTLEFSMVAHGEWPKLWGEIADDSQTRLVIITGTGEEFLGQRKSLPGGPTDRASLMTPKYWQQIMKESTAHVARLLDIPVPVISAVNGPVWGHGEIVLLNDIVIATPETWFRDTHLPEQVIPTDIWHILLPPLIGRIRTAYFQYTDQIIEAAEALRLGLVNEIVPADRLLERAYQIARHILRQPDANLQYLRRILTHEMRGKVHALVEYGLAVEGLACIDADWSDWVVDYQGVPPLDPATVKA